MVRPIDLQDNLSKAPLVSRAQQLQQSAPEMAHRQAGQATAQQQVIDRGRSLPAEADDRAELHREGGSGRHAGRRRRRAEARQPEEAPPARAVAAADSSHIDIVA
jgi:hypothetical protein